MICRGIFSPYGYEASPPEMIISAAVGAGVGDESASEAGVGEGVEVGAGEGVGEGACVGTHASSDSMIS